ncbi:PREDICTED: uncharacterized protein LOC107162973 [Diuraphis noxia]|uniref:uncharacterized protein LOC107162973 n=1 Tax=Diuraphis noxia TaxID=143948 RepID=UPI000763B86A|nr:PREDICTED: uncharacterized protein LOC107162973 [Diuraphis noxia]
MESSSPEGQRPSQNSESFNVNTTSNHCIETTGQHVTVRGCALDSGTLTTDTEIIRMSHCGGFYFDDKYVDGCLQSCDDADGCNPASPPKSLDMTLLMMLVVMPLIVRFMPHELAPGA